MEEKKFIGAVKCPKCGNMARYNPFDREYDCKDCGTLKEKDKSKKVLWIENFVK